MPTSLKKFFDKNFFAIMLSFLLFFYAYRFYSDNIFIFDYTSFADFSYRISNALSYDMVTFDLNYDFQFLAPIYAGVAAVLFLSLRKHLFPFQASHAKSYRQLLVKNMLISSLRVATAIYFAFLLIFILACATSSPTDPYEVEQATGVLPSSSGYFLFIDWFGEEFFFKHRVAYDFMVYTVQHFYAAFLYAILGSAFSLIFEKKYQVFLITTLYYYAATLFLNRLGYASFIPDSVGNILRYFEPGRAAIPNSLGNVSTSFFFFATLFPPLVPTAIILVRQVKYGKELI